MARRATIGAMKTGRRRRCGERIGARRGRFFRGVPMALRATKVNEDRAGMGRFSPPLCVFFNRAVTARPI